MRKSETLLTFLLLLSDLKLDHPLSQKTMQTYSVRPGNATLFSPLLGHLQNVLKETGLSVIFYLQNVLKETGHYVIFLTIVIIVIVITI